MKELLQIYLDFAADTGVLLIIFLFGMLVYGTFKGSKLKEDLDTGDIESN